MAEDPSNLDTPGPLLPDAATWDGTVHVVLRFDTPFGPFHSVLPMSVHGKPLATDEPMPATITVIDGYYDTASAWQASNIYQNAAYAQFKKTAH